MSLTPECLSRVPDLIVQFATLDPRQRLGEAEQAADVIACGADVLWAEQVPRNAEVAPDDVRHALTAGLAILALRPDGVTFAGLHWCAEHPTCPGPGKWTLPERAMTRSARGAFFTPREFAEETIVGALEDLAYSPGPRDTTDRDVWRLIPAVRLLDLRIGDIAVGSGVFLLAACRWLADRLAEAWHVEAGMPVPDLPPYNPMTLAARRLAMRCLRGVDIDPTSVELARISLALLAPTSPVDLAPWIVCGDSMLGITSLDQLASGHFDPATGVGILDPELTRLLGQVEAYVDRGRV